MTSTITRTSDSATTTPDLVLGYGASRESRNVIHDLIGGDIAVTLVTSRLRSGMLELFYSSEAEAWASFALHTDLADTFTLASDDVTPVDMTYVLGEGAVTVTLDDETRAVWVVAVDFQEVEL